MLKEKFNGSIIGFLLIVCLLVWAAVLNKPEAKWSVYFFDVGQGDAIYMRFPNGQDTLIDGGPDDKVLTQLGKVMPFYDHQLDLVILTHNHSDHLAGLLEVAKRYQLKEVWMSGATHTSDQYIEWLKILKDKGIKPKIVQKGYSEKFGKVEGQVIFPLISWQGKRPENQHDATVVTKWHYGKQNLLLTGDLEEEQEQLILQSHQLIKADVLKVPHHGSKTGLLEEFLKQVDPIEAVISVGAKNRYHHPAPSSINRLKKKKIRIWRTDWRGTIVFKNDGLRYEVLSQK